MNGVPIKVVLIYTAILCLTLLCGCISQKQDTNNSILLPSVSPESNKLNTSSTIMVPAHGYVLLNGSHVSGAQVKATSSDGSDIQTTTTNETGAYVVNIRDWTLYNITATYKGLRHTIWPVRIDSQDNSQLYKARTVYNITLTNEPTSTIMGLSSEKYILVEAIPTNGEPSVTTNTGPERAYSMNVDPNVQYDLVGRDYYEQTNFHVIFKGRNYHYVQNITLQPNETALIDVDATWLH